MMRRTLKKTVAVLLAGCLMAGPWGCRSPRRDAGELWTASVSSAGRTVSNSPISGGSAVVPAKTVAWRPPLESTPAESSTTEPTAASARAPSDGAPGTDRHPPTSPVAGGEFAELHETYAAGTDTIPGGIEFAEPRTHRSELPELVTEMSLQEAVELAVRDTRLLRSLGGVVLSNPQQVGGSLDPAIQRSDPNFGVAAALSQFDAQFQSSLDFAKNDDVFNNAVIGGGAREVRDDVTRGQYSLRKTNGFGTQFSVGSTIEHSDSSNPSFLFAHSWVTTWEASIRQPLLQGRGATFNQIAGPTNRPGLRVTSGVLISRINHDISMGQFETGLIEMVNEVIDAYWRLGLAYQNFYSIRIARDLSLSTWNVAKARSTAGLPGGEADREAQAREQYYRFESQLLAALGGNAIDGQLGVLEAEANLRRLLNLPVSDDRLIKPSDAPVLAKLIFDWQSLASTAVCHRVELRQQQQQIRRRELELIAARNFLLPRLDALVTYRSNGFGDDLAGGDQRFDSAWGDALSGDHRELEFGINYELPVGFRQAHAGVRNAKLELVRQNVIFEEQRQQVLYQLSNAYRRVDRIHSDLQLLANRAAAARATVDARAAAYQADAVDFDQLLDAQERLLQAELAYFQGTASYESAKADLQRESGQLLSEFGIQIGRP